MLSVKRSAGILAMLAAAAAAGPAARAVPALDLTNATVVVRDPHTAPLPERTAATVLTEEVAKRTGVQWKVATEWPKSGAAIALLSGKDRRLQGRTAPEAAAIATPEGFGLATDASGAGVLWIDGADARGALFGVGRVLRALECRPGSVRLTAPLNLTTAPAYPIRGHQLGYRATANTYDAWSPAQFDQYIRELTYFGANSVEGIPFHDTRPTVSTYPRSKMNVDISRICERYGLDYWIWAPADFDLKDAKKRADALQVHADLFRDCPRMDAVFVPGGDPGDNPADLVIEYLRDLSRILRKHHPHGMIWVSMQGYSGSEQDVVYRWIETERPKWLGGLVAGPSSPPLQNVRARLPKEYGVRDYPDITHSVRCQFSVPWWDPAYACTLGRECVNPRPLFFSRILADTAHFTNGFISYSDGSHDDMNKVVWSARTWDPSSGVDTIATEYARVFFGADVAQGAGAGILALEKDFEGPLAANGGVEATFALWRGLETHASAPKDNWRWQMYLLRAYYDTYTRRRLIHESACEDAANAALLTARKAGVAAAADAALAELKRSEAEPVAQDLCARVTQLCEDLYRSVGFQTSVEKYHAAGSERGAVLDFVNYPLNNRWWLEDEIAKARKLPAAADQVARLETLARWENPGPGSSYDDIGNVAKSPHEVRNERIASPILDMDNTMTASFMMWTGNSPYARVRQAWASSEDWPTALKYTGLDADADYVVRTTGVGECQLRANGIRIRPTADGKQLGDVKEFPLPRGITRDGVLLVTFDPTFEPQLNWRVQSRVTEVWLIKK